MEGTDHVRQLIGNTINAQKNLAAIYVIPLSGEVKSFGVVDRLLDEKLKYGLAEVPEFENSITLNENIWIAETQADETQLLLGTPVLSIMKHEPICLLVLSFDAESLSDKDGTQKELYAILMKNKLGDEICSFGNEEILLGHEIRTVNEKLTNGCSVDLIVSIEPMLDQFADFRKMIMFYTVIIGILAVVAAYGVSNSIARPLNQIIKKMNEFKSGDTIRAMSEISEVTMESVEISERVYHKITEFEERFESINENK